MTGWLRFFLMGPGAVLTVYVVLQTVAACKLTGRTRVLVLLPVPVVLWIVADTIEAYQAESNLWPLGLMAGSAAAIGYVGLVWLGAVLVARRQGLAEDQTP